VRGPHFADSEIYITKNFKLREGLTFRFDTQMFNAFNHPNFALPSNVQAGGPIRSYQRASEPCRAQFRPQQDY